MKYSQGDEQDWIAACVPAGLHALLDIGAYSPTHLSNSRALIEQGWTAVLVEPSPEPCLALLREYGKRDDIGVLSAAISSHDSGGIVGMAITSDALSTTEATHMEKWKDTGGYYGTLFVPTISLDVLFSRFYDFFRDGKLQFVNIDTEGTSVDLFKDLLHLGARPACICVEHDEKIPELCAAGTECGYHLHAANENNAVFKLRRG